jgi:hypothetical protein
LRSLHAQYVTGWPNLRFYAGAAIQTADGALWLPRWWFLPCSIRGTLASLAGFCLGSLSVADNKPRVLTQLQVGLRCCALLGFGLPSARGSPHHTVQHSFARLTPSMTSLASYSCWR